MPDTHTGPDGPTPRHDRALLPPSHLQPCSNVVPRRGVPKQMTTPRPRLAVTHFMLTSSLVGWTTPRPILQSELGHKVRTTYRGHCMESPVLGPPFVLTCLEHRGRCFSRWLAPQMFRKLSLTYFIFRNN